MRPIQLRKKTGESSPDDLTLQIQDPTYEYLMSSQAPEIRVSAYLDRDWPLVENMYEEIFIDENCTFNATITKLIPGSKIKREILLPCAMNEGEQLTILVSRSAKGA